MHRLPAAEDSLNVADHLHIDKEIDTGEMLTDDSILDPLLRLDQPTT